VASLNLLERRRRRRGRRRRRSSRRPGYVTLEQTSKEKATLSALRSFAR
jgi:hypothetical protein